MDPAAVVSPVAQRIEYAQHLIGLGMKVFPLAPNEKVPLTKNGFKDAHGNPSMAATFLGNPGITGYGVTVPAESDICLLDVDGDDWKARFASLADAIGVPWPKGPKTRTPHGWHLYFRSEEIARSAGGTLFGFVIRKPDKGYVVGPGSQTTDGAYEWVDGTLPIPEMPSEWVRYSHLTETSPHSGVSVITIADHESEGYQLPPLGYSGSRYDAIRDFAASRYNRLGGVGARDEVLASVLAVLAPRFASPLTSEEVTERFERVWKGIAASLGPPMVRTRASGGVQGDLDIPMALPKPSIFPDPPSVEAFGLGVADMAVLSLASLTSASEIGMLMTLLSAWGGLFGTTCEYHGTQMSSLFGVLIGETGRGRKGTATRAVWTALERALAPTSASNPSALISLPLSTGRWDGAASGEALIRVLSDAKGTDLSALVGGFVVEEEFENVLRKVRSTQNYSSTLGTTLQKAFDGAMLQNMTKMASQRVYPPYTVGLLGNITVEVLRLLMPPELVSGGFANRFLWVPVTERDVAVDGTIPWAFDPAVVELLQAAHARWKGGARAIALTSDGYGLLQEYATFLQQVTGPLAKFTPRMHVLALRAAMVHASLDQVDEVDEELVGRGIALTEYCRRGLVWAFSSDTGDDWVDALVDALREAGATGLTGREVARLLGNNAARINRTRNIAISTGLATAERVVSGPGRPLFVLRAALEEALWGFVRTGHAQVPTPTRSSPSTTDQTLSSKNEQTPNKGVTNVDKPLQMDTKQEGVHVDCHFPAEHSTRWVNGAEGWYCEVCR